MIDKGASRGGMRYVYVRGDDLPTLPGIVSAPTPVINCRCGDLDPKCIISRGRHAHLTVNRIHKGELAFDFDHLDDPAFLSSLLDDLHYGGELFLESFGIHEQGSDWPPWYVHYSGMRCLTCFLLPEKPTHTLLPLPAR